MATYHIGSFDQATSQAFSATGRVIAINANPYNANQCVAIDDSNFSNWGSSKGAVQQVRVPGAGKWIAVMPYSSNGVPTFYGFTSDADLLNNAQFVPDFGGGTIGGGAFSTSSDVAQALSNQGGMLIDSAGNPIVT